MAKKDLIDYIKKSHLKAVEKFNEELKAFTDETGEKEAIQNGDEEDEEGEEEV